jgi:hypothetical protein
MTNELDDFLGEYNRKVKERDERIKDQNQRDSDEKESFLQLFSSLNNSVIEPSIKVLRETLNKHGHKIEKDGILRNGRNYSQGYDIKLSNGFIIGFDISGDTYSKNIFINFSTKTHSPIPDKTNKQVCKPEELTTQLIMGKIFEEIKKVLVV